MFTIKEITNEEAYQFFISEPALTWLGFSDDFIVQLYEHHMFDPGPYSNIRGIYLDDILIMVFKYEFYSKVALNTHYYLSRLLHKRGVFEKVVACLNTWIKEQYPSIKKILVMSPSACEHIPAIVKKYGFIEEARIKDVVVWRKEICDNVIYSLELT